MSDFWGIAQNRVKTAKNGLIPELSTLVHNLSTISTEVWISLLITCGEAEENPKTAAAAGERDARQKSFGFWLLGCKMPKKKTRAPLWVLQKWKSGKYGGACPKNQFGRQPGVLLS